MSNRDLMVRELGADDVDTAIELMFGAFFEDPTPESRADEKLMFEAERFQGVYDGELRMVGTGGILDRQMTVPGLVPTPVAAVTGVGVAVDYRRRGVLSTLIRHQLHELHVTGGPPFAALWASEAGIYGRFGYGLASRRARTTIKRPVSFRRDVVGDPTEVRVELARPSGEGLHKLHAEYIGSRIGGLSRPPYYWQCRFADHESSRGGWSALRVAVHDDGYATFRVKEDWREEGPRHLVSITELAAATPHGYASLWRFLADLDLVEKVRYAVSPIDQPLPFMLTDPRAVTVEVTDALFVRLVDVDRALTARRYAAPVDVVFELTDEFCPWNSGRWRLAVDESGAAEVTRTGDAADLACTTTELGAAFLGGTRLHVLAAAGQVTELTKGALPAASAAFAGENEPHCMEVF